MRIIRGLSLPDLEHLHLNDCVFDVYLGKNPISDVSRRPPRTHVFMVMNSLFARSNTSTFEDFKDVLDEMRNYRVAALFAHGSSKDGEWRYEYGGDRFPLVQSWIDRRDQEGYGALLIASCNEGRVQPVARKTPIFYGEGIMGVTSDDYVSCLMTPSR